MNYPLDHAIMSVASKIPPQILEIALRHSNKKYHQNNNLTEWICNKIINYRVLKDVNLTAGQVKTIILKPSWIESTTRDHEAYAGDDGPWTIYRIPPDVRDNKSISQVMTVQFPYHTYQSTGIANADVASGGWSLVDQVDQIINSYTNAIPRNHPLVTLMSGDLVKLTPSQYTRQFWLLTCRINYDETFNNLPDSSIRILSDLVLFATRSWIYNNLIVEIDRSVQETGMDIGTIRSIVEGYANAEEQYEEAYLKFRGASVLDPEYRRRLYFYML